MGKLQRKGSYFYVIDAFIASIIILGAIVILFSQFLSQQSATQAYYTAEDFLSSLESTQIRSYDDITVRAWIANGTVTDPQRSLLEQLVFFKATGDTVNAQLLATKLAQQTPQVIGIDVLVDGQIYYPTSSQVGLRASKSAASSLLTAKRIVLIRQSPSSTYPPSVVEVRTWQ